MLYLKTLATVTQNELQVVGYRAQDLALIAEHRIEVPQSFIVQSNAFEELVRANNLKYKIDYIMSHAQVGVQHSLVNAYNGVRKAMLEATLPAGFETELRSMFDTVTAPLSVGDLVAKDRTPIRIIVSMNRLDDPENNDTIIQNVNGYDELLVALREAWALSYHPSQLGSRLRDKIPESQLKVALIVQTMDKPYATVISYSCLPQDHNKIYLQSHAGYLDLRERISKDFYAVGKNGLRTVASQTGRQKGMLERNEQGELVVVPMQTRFELIARDILESSRLTKRAEALLQTPVKVYLSVYQDAQEILWVNRLGFDVIVRDETASVVEREVDTILKEMPSKEDFLVPQDLETVAVPVSESIMPDINSSSSDVADSNAVAARLLNASLRIVRQIVNHKYTTTFSQSTTEDIAQMVQRLNQAGTFSRPVDGMLLLQAEQAAHNAGHLSRNNYAKVIEEVAYLMSYAAP